MNIEQGLVCDQVLQRRASGTAAATLTGLTTATGDVVVTVFDLGVPLSGWHQRVVGTAANGRFSATIDGIPAGGPYNGELRIGDDAVTVNDIFVGDVWLLAGQSNMEGVGLLANAGEPSPLARALFMNGQWGVAKDPLHVTLDSLDKAHNPIEYPPLAVERMRRLQTAAGVGPGVFFGKEMAQKTGVPQGLLCTAHGGTSMLDWSPDKKHLGGDSYYGSMLRVVQATGQPVAGVLWYQGENETGSAEDVAAYTARMTTFVAAVRADLGQPRLPFIIAQLGRYFALGVDHRGWNSIQSQQYKLQETIENLTCVATVDLPLEDVIHISSHGCARLGARFARVADRVVLGNVSEPPPPSFVSAVHVPGDHRSMVVDVTFDHVVGGLQAVGEPQGFALVDADMNVYSLVYKTTLSGSTARLECAVKENAGAYRLMYGAGLAPTCTITDSRGFSLPVFGPVTITPSEAMGDYACDWLVSGLTPAVGSIDEQEYPNLAELSLAPRHVAGPFVSMIGEWKSATGRAFFVATVDVPEDMDVRLRFGYDGPFRLWLDGAAVHTDVNGTNPIIIDEHTVPVSLTRGAHEITCAMDFTTGFAWGFVLRIDRTDLSAEQIAAGGYVMPAWNS
ncbi:MAG TPA: sialate O-acetylesterase [Capsulimonadaceae bacterium]|jgi:sialate O-acetylesterase